MADKNNVLGIDIGSISISIAELTIGKEVTNTAYSFHKGKIAETLTRLLSGFDLTKIYGIAATSATPSILKEAAIYDSRISFITAARYLNKKVGSILIVGGEKFGLVLFDKHGQYQNYRSNTSCAAGTGSFLDQQAVRLNLSGIEEFSEIAYNNSGKIPKIASRCAVFAKTDLIHAQQEGYSLTEICDGLSYGLVKNIADTLFSNVSPNEPLIFCGGVSKNRAVVKHISGILDIEVITDEYSHVYGAIGAAINLIENADRHASLDISEPAHVIAVREKKKQYCYEPLSLQLSEYPEFDSARRYEYLSKRYTLLTPVEVDIYAELVEGKEYPVYLGIDIGSTSTKAVIVDDQKNVLGGFYTRTSGRPVQAIQIIFESIDNVVADKNIAFHVLGVGTTGSGRKFIAEIISADIALDEITAHARAAYELDTEVDTVIEIGGQDSKFTTIRNGMVTFSIMNNVCAAGTGSFIEEQAKKLGCLLSEYSERAEHARAPLSSDRCTVFMERDLNYYLYEGYAVNEVLASVLHSVRDNYLSKVAIEKNIGDKIFFQGATAKNKALVAAFEQRLGKPIMVSKFCHLTGALGVALHLYDQNQRETGFRGFDLYKHDIPVRTEVCELCTNHCKIKIAEVNNATVAFGFLCDRDYGTEKYVSHDLSFDLLKERKKIFSHRPAKERKHSFTIGLPAALHIYAELPLWKRFFDRLSIRTISSENYMDGIKAGKNLTGAEFCAPIAALHGHVAYLSQKADYIFLPYYIEEKQHEQNMKRNYCYYTQYVPSVITSAIKITNKGQILTPTLRTNNSLFYLKAELYRMLNTIQGYNISFTKVSHAYDMAIEYYQLAQEKLKEICVRESTASDDIRVVFVGRPYTILSHSMNNGIPEIFAKLGIKTFFQDMLTYEKHEIADIEPLLRAIHWKYAAKICEAAAVIAKKKGLYAVFVTSFKCTPDAYTIEYVKKIFDSHNKPYLILQLDEHDSSVGYETRIEAGIRAFRNHFRSGSGTKLSASKVNISTLTRNKKIFTGKTLLIPNWDNITCKLLEAAVRKEGIDARIIDVSMDSIRKSMSLNTGQCIPLNIIIQNSIDFIERNNLDPEKTVVWSPDSKIACNLGMFPYFTKDILESYGNGLEKIPVFLGHILFLDISIRTAINCYLAYMLGGMLRKIGCSIRPYEKIKGMTDRAVEESVKILYNMFLEDMPKENIIHRIVSMFEDIEIMRENRPKVAIFGDLYVQDNDIMNQNLIRTIEINGGEVVTTPYSQYINIITDRYIKKWFAQGLYGYAAFTKILRNIMNILDHKYYKYFERFVPDQPNKNGADPEELLSRFHLNIYHTGESMDNLLKIFHLIHQYPDLALFVQTNPSYCCPSLVTEAMADKIETLTGIPVVTIEYDGTGGSKNEDVIPYLKYPQTHIAKVGFHLR